MVFINYIYICICDTFRKISFLTIQSITNIIKLSRSNIFKIESSTYDISKNNKNYKKNKNSNKYDLDYNTDNDHHSDWGWFVEIDDVHMRR